MKRIALFALAAVTIAGAAVPALADAPIARASAHLKVYSAPNSSSRQIGELPKGVEVYLDRCTLGSKWCLVENPYGNNGWVRGSYLVGSAAKLEATPNEFLFDYSMVYEPKKLP